jgi:50S ribosomal protein L16 3-hydroxylase
LLAFPPSVPGQDASGFLERHWQKQALWMPGAAQPDLLPDIDADELAWLATLEDVESRLVISEHHASRTTYTMESGPFEAARLASLPDSGWTLLLQDVEKHLPDLRRMFALVPFIPDWRIDDLMISVAAPGGSVGPHIDNYDVFLVQLAGQRDWRWTSDAVPDDPAASSQLRLVEAFTSGDNALATPADVLYINPGVAHYGVALDLCITCSIGMRAPQLSELAGRAVEQDDVFYTDADLTEPEARPGWLSDAAVKRARRLLRAAGYPEVDAVDALGRYATTPKHWLTPLSPGDMPLPDGALELHGMARLAFNGSRVYANGRRLAMPDTASELVAGLCATRSLPRDERPALTRDAAKLLDGLWHAGAFDQADDELPDA